MRKNFNWIFSIFLVISIILIISFVIAIIYPYNLVDYNYDKYKILTPVVKRGTQVIFESEFYKHTDLSATVSRQLIDGNVYYYAEMPATNPQGYNKIKVTLDIPSYAEPGKYYIRSIIKYRVNFLRTITYINDTEYFEIIE